MVAHPAESGAQHDRLLEVDSLRGVAAVAVMLFHYTTRYDELFVHTSDPGWSVPWGHLGVNLFFMISGFVIFMTLEKTKHPLDFIVSRASRLYPVYWTAVLVTWLLTLLSDLPGKTVSPATAIGNALMFHGLLQFKHVDGVYWTLEVELLFYSLMLLLWSLNLFSRLYLVCVAWLGCKLAYLGFSYFFNIDLPYIVSRFLILDYIAYFLIGVITYRVHRTRRAPSSEDVSTIALCFLTILLDDGVGRCIVALLLASLLWTAVFYRPSFLRLSPIVWLGAVSYPVYLLHENIGWGTILHLEASGMSANVSISVAIVLTLLLAWVLHRLVEKPAMAFIRRRYSAAKAATTGRTWDAKRWSAGTAATLCTLAAASFMTQSAASSPPRGLSNSLHIRATGNFVPTPCTPAGGSAPFVIVALGQSNAANHVGSSSESPELTIFFDGNCHVGRAPLLGATGSEGSIWPWLAFEIEKLNPGRSVVIAPLAVDSTEIRAWVTQGPLRDRLLATLSALKSEGLEVSVILWQQGEADAQKGTSSESYLKSFELLRTTISAAGVTAPIVVARSTYCRGDGFGVIRRTQQTIPHLYPGVLSGPNTDALRGSYRSDDCHFSEAGARKAALLWRDALVTLVNDASESRINSDDQSD